MPILGGTIFSVWCERPTIAFLLSVVGCSEMASGHTEDSTSRQIRGLRNAGDTVRGRTMILPFGPQALRDNISPTGFRQAGYYVILSSDEKAEG